MSAAFSVIGPIALINVLGNLAEKFDPLEESGKRNFPSLPNGWTGNMLPSGKRLERLNIETLTAQFRKVAGMRLAAFYSDSDIAADKARIQDIGRQIADEQRSYRPDRPIV